MHLRRTLPPRWRWWTPRESAQSHPSLHPTLCQSVSHLHTQPCQLRHLKRSQLFMRTEAWATLHLVPIPSPPHGPTNHQFISPPGFPPHTFFFTFNTRDPHGVLATVMMGRLVFCLPLRGQVIYFWQRYMIVGTQSESRQAEQELGVPTGLLDYSINILGLSTGYKAQQSPCQGTLLLAEFDKIKK